MVISRQKDCNCGQGFVNRGRGSEIPGTIARLRGCLASLHFYFALNHQKSAWEEK
jgi:hypothetical protein